MKTMKLKKLLLTSILSLGLSVSAFAGGHKYSIDASNVSDYADMLSAGQLNMFAQYPDTYRMDVYDSSSDCQIDADVKAISQTNGTMINDNEGFEVPNAGQVPFPNPTDAQHFVWNYRMAASHVNALYRVQTSTKVEADGSITTGQQETNITFPRNPRTKGMYADKNLYALFMQKNLGPPRTAGTVTLVHDFIDSYMQPRKAWQYNPATRRVRRAPDITYDTLTTAGGGIVTVDQYGGFNGAQDRYDWSYEGKKKMIVPMSNDALADNAIETTHTVNHLNPDYVRYEERDVHVVHAQLKPGQRHLYASRTMYFMDDDLNMLTLHDMYDGNQELMRHYFAGTVKGSLGGSGSADKECNLQGEYTFDFATRTYAGGNLLGAAISPTPVVFNSEEKPISFYTPDGLRRYAR